MNWLTDLDLETQAFDKFLMQDNSTNRDEILTNIEHQNIELIKAKLNNKYDTQAIFSTSGNDRHWLIVKILAILVIYDFFRRNAARKIPKDYQERYEWAMKLLEDIKAGNEVPAGLPFYTDETGNEPNLLYGNNKNKDFYI